jgi:hypothetical protein
VHTVSTQFSSGARWLLGVGQGRDVLRPGQQPLWFSFEGGSTGEGSVASGKGWFFFFLLGEACHLQPLET